MPQKDVKALNWRDIAQRISTESDTDAVLDLAKKLIRALDKETAVTLANSNKSEDEQKVTRAL